MKRNFLRTICVLAGAAIATLVVLCIDRAAPNESKAGIRERAKHRPSGLATPARPSRSEGGDVEVGEVRLPEYLRISSDFGKFEPRKIVAFLENGDNFPGDLEWAEFVNEYGEYLCSLVDSEMLLAHIREFTEDYGLPDVLKEVAERSKAMTPQTMAATLLVLKSERQVQLFAQGIRNRIRSAPDADTRIQLAVSYLSENPPPAVASAIAAAGFEDVLGNGVDFAKNWVRGLADDVSAEAEAMLVRHLAAKDPDEAISYLDLLLEEKDFPRAESAIKSFFGSFSSGSPKAALEWALALPEDLGAFRELIILQGYINYANVDPNAAKKDLISEVGNPDVLDRILKQIEQIPSMSVPR